MRLHTAIAAAALFAAALMTSIIGAQAQLATLTFSGTIAGYWDPATDSFNQNTTNISGSITYDNNTLLSETNGMPDGEYLVDTTTSVTFAGITATTSDDDFSFSPVRWVVAAHGLASVSYYGGTSQFDLIVTTSIPGTDMNVGIETNISAPGDYFSNLALPNNYISDPSLFDRYYNNLGFAITWIGNSADGNYVDEWFNEGYATTFSISDSQNIGVGGGVPELPTWAMALVGAAAVTWMTAKSKRKIPAAPFRQYSAAA